MPPFMTRSQSRSGRGLGVVLIAAFYADPETSQVWILLDWVNPKCRATPSAGLRRLGLFLPACQQTVPLVGIKMSGAYRLAKIGAALSTEQLLVSILNSSRDLELARNNHWYRIPVSSVEKWLARRWPPQWLAFYQTKVCGAEAFAINYNARVLKIRQA